MSLAVVIASCDRYSWFWPTWYHYFSKNFGFEYPVYLINESTPCNLDGVTQILSPVSGVEYWTKMLREAIKQIPEDDLFVLMDDFVIKEYIDIGFLYKTFKSLGMDSLRIMAVKNKWSRLTFRTSRKDVKFYSLDEDSDYSVSFSPNIWRKAFLLDCIKEDMNPWTCELSLKVKGDIWHTEILGWYAPVLHNGVLTKEGEKLKIRKE